MAKVVNNFLADYGYNLVALPKEGIAPLLLLYKNNGGVSAVENKLYHFFTIADSPPPQISKDNQVIGIKGTANIAFDADGGINMLEWLLQKLKMGKLSGSFQLDASHTVKIAYENVTEDKVPLLALDNFISGSEPDPGQFNTFRQKLENSELYVVSAVLKSNCFSIAVEGKDGQQADLEGRLKGALDAHVALKRQHDNSILLKHDQANPIVFAFKAQRILYDKQKWWQFFNKKEAKFRIKDQQGLILKDESDFPTDPLSSGALLVDI